MTRPRCAAVAAGAVGALTIAASPGAAVAQAAAAPSRGHPVVDFNGDGYADLAVGAPGEDLPGAKDAGAVNVLYGSASGVPGSGGNQLWTQDSENTTERAEAGDQFGFAVAAGDVDGDGFTDLAVGSPGEDLTHRDAGLVQVIFGSRNGLEGLGSQVASQESMGVPGYSRAGDRFGSSLAAGDFSGGPASDLAIGVPFADDAAPDGGAVIVISGSGQGLHPGGVQRWTQDTPGIGESTERGDQFGTTLAAGDLGHDGHDDLVVGVPHEDRSGHRDAGVVHVIYGGDILLSASGSQVWTQDSPGVPEAVEAGDRFGAGLATGNLGHDGHDDLAVGVPGEDRGGRRDAGVAEVVYGSAGGLRSFGSQLWSQASRGVAGGAEAGDRFGSSLAAGNLGRSHYADLAVGVPGEDLGRTRNAGAVNVIYGSAAGVSPVGDQLWSQASRGVAGDAEAGDRFGSSLAAGNLGRSQYADLAVGVPGEDLGRVRDAGAVNLLHGATGGLTRVGNHALSQGTHGVADVAEPGDRFGQTLPAP